MVKQKDTNIHHADMKEGAKRGYILSSVANSEDIFYSSHCYFSVLYGLESLILVPASKSPQLSFFFQLRLSKFRFYPVSTKSSVPVLLRMREISVHYKQPSFRFLRSFY
jgi:hypothetical protein